MVLFLFERISSVVMRDNSLRPAEVSRRLACLAFVLWVCIPSIASSQTPSPLEEWQYSGGIILEKLFEPNLPEWRVVLGAGAEARPLYDGASLTKIQGGPVINVRYRDLAFASVGEGVGVNLLHGDNYRAGILLGYDLGRRVSDDYGQLRGLGDIGRAPVAKVFASYAISKAVPLVFRADVRQIIGGADGLLADFGLYMPLPGSSKKLIMFAGPSITYADHRYLQKEFGVTTTQALASGYPVYDVHSGANAAGLGFSATRFLTDHWLINMDAAVNQLLGSARESPITQRSVQRVLALSFAYTW
jgi:outer membrane scaffolding protein for murein synthesis (MipA/OmpV family)